MPFLIAAVVTVLIVAAVLYIVIRRFFKIAFERDDRERSAAERLSTPWSLYISDVENGEKWFFDHCKENLEITSRDGIRLRGFFVPCDNAKGTLIMFHGYRSDGFADYSLMFEHYHSIGLNIVLVHHRAHLTSEGKYITFGLAERYDCLDWANYIAKKIGGDIWLMGVSMGASTVLMSAQLGLPNNVKGIIADSGFTSPWEELKYVLKRDYKLPPFPILYLVNFRFKRLTGHDLREINTTDVLKNCKIPVLFIHGSADNFVPPDMTSLNYSACASDRSLLIADGAEHAMSSWADTDEYKSNVLRFINATA